MDELEGDLKRLIIDVLRLEDLEPQDIDSEAPLFGPELGLTSIDALELAMALNKKFGIVLDPDNEQNRAAFSSVRALASALREQRSSTIAST